MKKSGKEGVILRAGPLRMIRSLAVNVLATEGYTQGSMVGIGEKIRTHGADSF